MDGRIIKSLVTGKKPRHSKIVRLLHWLYAPAILNSLFSGLYINRPSKRFGYKNMYSAQKNHFIAQFVVIFSFLARVCYAFKEQNYKEIIPNNKTLRNIPKFIKYEFFMTNKKPKFPKYNPGQKILFTGLVLLILIQIITGLTLYFSKTCQKTDKLAGGLNHLRKIHFLTAIGNAVLIAGHLYFVLTHGFKTLKSIFTGYE